MFVWHTRCVCLVFFIPEMPLLLSSGVFGIKQQMWAVITWCQFDVCITTKLNPTQSVVQLSNSRVWLLKFALKHRTQCVCFKKHFLLLNVKAVNHQANGRPAAGASGGLVSLVFPAPSALFSCVWGFWADLACWIGGSARMFSLNESLHLIIPIHG